MRYTSSITTATLRLRETRLVADLLLRDVTPTEWRRALVDDNLFQARSTASAFKLAAALRARIAPLGPDLWRLLVDAPRDLATQAAFAAAVHNSRLLGDFLDIAVREQRTLFATHLTNGVFSDYTAGCCARDPDMPDWSDATIAKLRSATFAMLAEAGYLADTRTLRLQTVFVADPLVDLLRASDQTYILRCLQVME